MVADTYLRRLVSLLGTSLVLFAFVFGTSCSTDDGGTDQTPAQAPRAAISVMQAPPYAVGDTVLFDGSGSEPTGAGLTYVWTILAAPSTSAATTASLAEGLAELVPDVAGDYVVELTVSNADGQDTAYAQLTVDAAPQCLSNIDCAEPATMCDTTQGLCVQCLVTADCGHLPGTLCIQGACACEGGLDWCGPNVCVDAQTDPDHCGQCRHQCYGGCSAGACAGPWEPVSQLDAPMGRYLHVAVWTPQANGMIVWGGATASGDTNTGGLYDPDTHTWTPTSPVNAPSARNRATAVWTGTEMIVWGGQEGAGYFNTGARYDPLTDTWVAMSTIGAPEGRIYHTAVWTGTHMIVWAGDNNAGEQLNSGGVYDPATDTWTATVANTTGVTRRWHTAVWNDTLDVMQIYGGWGAPPGVSNQYLPYTNTPGGEQYNPVANTWQPLSVVGEPSPRARHTAIFTGADMIIWGGFNGSTSLGNGLRYTQGAWLSLAGPAPEARHRHTAVYFSTLDRMIVWGGEGASSTYLGSGAEFDVANNTWTTPLLIAPEGRRYHTSVATDDRMIVWGGQGASALYLDTGGIYTPAP